MFTKQRIVEFKEFKKKLSWKHIEKKLLKQHLLTN